MAEAVREAPRSRRWTRIALFGVAVIAIAFAVRALPVAQWLTSFQAWAEGQGVLGMAVFALVYAASVVAFVPASVLTLGAGAVYGLWTGTAVVLVGASLGAVLSFLLARTVLRKRVESMTAGSARFRALDRAIAKEGGKIVFLVRLAPVFPFTYINYAFGLTGIKTLPYSVATIVGMIPGTFAYVYLGAAAATAATADEASATRTALQIGGAIAAVLVTILVARVAARAIREAGVEET